MASSPEVQQLQTALQSATERANRLNAEAVTTSIEIGKERTQYFDKIALGSAGAIAAVISFLGSHAAHLQPGWLLRTCLISLALTMTCAMLRNWIYPFYLLAAKGAPYLEAKQTCELTKRDYLEAATPINLDEWIKEHLENDKTLTAEIARVRKLQSRYFRGFKAAEGVALVLAVMSMVLLIWLAWQNF